MRVSERVQARRDEGAEDRRWLILAVLCFSLLVIVLDNSILNVALPAIVRELDATNTQLQWIVDDVAPDTVLTFGPDGMTGHPDHRAVSAWTTAAWASCRRRYPGARLWYATLLPSFHQEWGRLNGEIGIFPPEATPPETPEDEAAAIVRCDGWLARRKAAALRAHASQVGPLIEAVGEDVFDRWWEVEAFVDAARVPAGVS